MNAAEFEEVALALIDRAYSPIPIMPGSKSPGERSSDGSWRSMSRWQKWCFEPVSVTRVEAWLRMIGDSEVGLGVALGRGLICIDIDQEYLLDPILAILPPSPVQKKGRKGVSLFYRGDTEKIRSRNYRTDERVGLLDLLSEGKQTILPPSIHPDTNEPYFWWGDLTLADVPLSELPELPNDIAEQIAEVLKPFGYDPEAERPALVRSDTPARSAGGARASSIYRQANDDALANLDCWVPELHLYRWRRKPGGYEAVAHWRSSGTGRALELRKRNLSIVRKGIEDFGDGRKYTPIDLVKEARGCDANAALDWLLERLPDDEPEVVLVNGPKTLERIRAREGM
jgi:hypothetical protein